MLTRVAHRSLPVTAMAPRPALCQPSDDFTDAAARGVWFVPVGIGPGWVCSAVGKAAGGSAPTPAVSHQAIRGTTMRATSRPARPEGGLRAHQSPRVCTSPLATSLLSAGSSTLHFEKIRSYARMRLALVIAKRHADHADHAGSAGRWLPPVAEAARPDHPGREAPSGLLQEAGSTRPVKITANTVNPGTAAPTSPAIATEATTAPVTSASTGQPPAGGCHRVTRGTALARTASGPRTPDLGQFGGQRLPQSRQCSGSCRHAAASKRPGGSTGRCGTRSRTASGAARAEPRAPTAGAGRPVVRRRSPALVAGRRSRERRYRPAAVRHAASKT